MLKGLTLSVIVMVVAIYVALLPLMSQWAISPMVLAMLIGMVIGNTPNLSLSNSQAGLSFAQKYILRAGVALFGFNLTLQQVIDIGWMVVIVDAVVVFGILFVGYWIGTRVLKLDPVIALLTSTGSAICGAAAILATESVVSAKQEQTAMAVATVVLFGSLAMITYPMFYPYSGMSEGEFGIYIGSTLHEVAQAVAAGQQVGPEAMNDAVVTKLVRVVFLIPFLLLITRLFPAVFNGSDTHAVGRPFHKMVPWFVVFFAGCVLLNTWLPMSENIHYFLTETAKYSLTIAMAALGLNTRFSSLKQLGIGPLLLALILFLMLSIGGWGVNTLLIH